MTPGRRKTAFVTVNLTEPARDALRQATLHWTTPAGRRVTMSDVLLSALAVARAHGAEVVADLIGEEDAEKPPPS
jgi:hypothetical protein